MERARPSSFPSFWKNEKRSVLHKFNCHEIYKRRVCYYPTHRWCLKPPSRRKNTSITVWYIIQQSRNDETLLAGIHCEGPPTRVKPKRSCDAVARKPSSAVDLLACYTCRACVPSWVRPTLRRICQVDLLYFYANRRWSSLFFEKKRLFEDFPVILAVFCP